MPIPFDYAESRETDPGFVPPNPNYGPAAALEVGFKQGFESNFTGMGIRALKYWGERNKDKPDLIDKETFDREYSLGGALKFDGHANGKMARGYAKALMEDRIDDEMLKAQSSMSFSPIASFVGSMAGGLFSPVDLAVNAAIPEYAIAKFGMGATVASRSGIGAARLFSRTVNGAVNGAAQAAVFQAPMAMLSSHNQTEYTIQDAMSNIAMGPLIGGAAGFLHGSVKHVMGEWDRSFANAVMHAAMTDKDPARAAKIAADSPAGQGVRDISAKIREVFNKPERTVEDQDIIHMASAGVPDDMASAVLSRRTRDRNAANRKIIDEVLATAEGRASWIDSAEQMRQDTGNGLVRIAQSDDEKFLAEAWKTLFGVDLKFVNKEFARNMGFLGFTRSSEPTKAYITEGALNDGSVESMMFVAGHELAHTIRLRDAQAWDSMVSAMMATSKDSRSELAKSWLTVTQHSRESGVWAGLDTAGKMDETFATVFGRATLDKTFWQSLHASSPQTSERLGRFLYNTRAKLDSLLGRSGASNQTRTLYNALTEALNASGIDQKALAIPGQTRLNEIYAPHVPEFKRFMRMMSNELNARGALAETDLAQFVRWHNDMFPEVAEIEDNSATPSKPGRFSTVRRNVRIDSNNPGLWLLQNVFAKSKKGTPEYELAQKFAQRQLVWDFKQDKRTASGAKDYASTAMRLGPLAAFKRNADGTWDVGVFRNDEFPRWHEVFDDLPPSTELTSQAWLEESLADVRDKFDAFVLGEKAKDPNNLPPSYEFNQYLGSLEKAELDEMVAKDPQALWQGFAEYLEEKMGEFRLASDPKAYGNLAEQRRQIDPLMKVSDEKPSEATSSADLEKAWEKFRKDYQAISGKLTERNLAMSPSETLGPVSWGVSTEPTPEFFARLFKDVRAEIAAEMEEVLVGMKNILNFKDGKPLEFEIAKGLVSDYDKNLSDALDNLAHERIRESGRWPQYDRVNRIVKYIDAADRDTISISQSKVKDLPDLFKDASEQFDVMSDLSDSIDYMAASRSLTEEEASMLSRVRLDREHQQWAKVLTSYESEVQTRIDEALTRNGADGWTLDPKPKPAGGTQAAPPPPPTPIVQELDAIKARHEFQQKILQSVAAGKPIRAGFEDVEQALRDRFEWHKRQGMSDRSAESQTSKDLKRDAQSKVLRALLQHEASKTILGRAKAGLDSLHSWLDGVARKNVQGAGASVAEAMSSRVINDATPFTRDLVSIPELDDKWVANDETLMRGLINHIKGTKISSDPYVKQLAETLVKTHEMQTGRLNANGANVRLLEGYVFSQVHNPYYIRRSEAEFIGDLSEWLDWDAVERMQGPNTPKGFDRQLYLKQLHHEMSKTDRPLPANFDPETMGGNLASRASQRRTLHFKDSFAFDYDMKYGSGNTSGLIIEQIIKRAETSVLMENFGPDYKKTWNHVMSQLGNVPGFRLGSKLGRIDLTMQGLTGDLNHPADTKIAAMGQAVRQVMNSVALWMSGVSSITDIGNSTSTMRWMGMTAKDLNSQLFAAMKEQAFKKPENRQFLLAQGAGLQAILSAFARTQAMDGPAYRLAQKASDITFKYNGQEIWGRTLQSAFHDLTTQHLGQMAKGDLTTEFVNWLSFYGITKEEWSSMAQHAADVEGLHGTRLAPDMIPNEALSQKLRVAMTDSMHQAILEPTVSDRSYATIGTKAGTFYGEAVRSMMQYKAYPLAMVRRVQRRFANAYGNEGLYAGGKAINKGRLAWLAWSGSMLSLAATALAVKDVLRGREPLNPFDTEQWTVGNVARVVSQAGVGPFAAAEQFLSPHQSLGPAPGALYSLGRGVATGNGYATTNAVMGMTPFLAAAPIKEMSKAALGSIFTETYGMHYQQFLRQLEAETGQTSIFLDNKSQSRQ